MKQNPELPRRPRQILLTLVGLCLLILLLDSSLLGGDAEYSFGANLDDKTANNSLNNVPVPALLHEACIANKDAVIPWQFGSPRDGHQRQNATADNDYELINRNDSNLLEKLKRCPDVDIFLPLRLRGNGYCEDAVAYAKYLDSRLLPMWALEIKLYDDALGREVDYFDLCPKTPMIFFNHYWNGVPESPRWPKNKPLYLMPNIEMFELTSTHYWKVDVVLCKTHVCYDRVTRWYSENGSPRNVKVFYTKHTSSDQAEFARQRLGNTSIAPKDFSGVLSPGMPPLDVFIDDSSYNRLFPQTYQLSLNRARSPVHIKHGMLEPQDFNKLIAESAFFMCPSRIEGYGHYLNQARASGGVVVTTETPPMNELILSSEMGVLIPTESERHPKMLLGGKYEGERGLNDTEGLLATFNSSGLCNAIQHFVSSTTTKQRAAMGARARQQYHEDTKFFAQSMHKLRLFTRN
ncbi:hypothetical protein GN244_ATG16316 [Phytophthora infestans]|uniref:Glycosyl transferase family 1 domain-containing protein n=1 Tax=Phytophthora infestans TaxID=4787 RepID=A0A833SB02_PHYIN|nr:hypothetical protein GN244_ATG16316 [Phytophthora infestans]KAF4129886.1 hypothetical protein GN958_ATG20889 [Phytophthora infestans]